MSTSAFSDRTYSDFLTYEELARVDSGFETLHDVDVARRHAFPCLDDEKGTCEKRLRTDDERLAAEFQLRADAELALTLSQGDTLRADAEFARALAEGDAVRAAQEALSAAAIPVRGEEMKGTVTATGAVIDGAEYTCKECGAVDNMCFYLSVENGSEERARALKARLAPEANRLSALRGRPPLDFGKAGVMADEEVFQAAAKERSIVVAHHDAGHIRLYERPGAKRPLVYVHLMGAHFRRLEPVIKDTVRAARSNRTVAADQEYSPFYF